MMAEALGLSSCPSGFALKSKLLHKPQVQYGFVSKLSHHGGKTAKTESRSQILLDCAEVQE